MNEQQRPTAYSTASTQAQIPQRRLRRLRMRPGMHIYILPNLITIMNLFMGFLAIVQSIQGQYVFAAYAIVAAAVFDQLDGRVARMTHSQSKFGAELDSLCDLVSFGTAPGIPFSCGPFNRSEESAGSSLSSFVLAAPFASRASTFNMK